MINLRDGVYRLISLQFLIANLKILSGPTKLLRVEPEKSRNYDSSGELAILPQKNCTLSIFVSNLRALGYELVDAFLVERADGKYKARFVFVDQSHAVGSDHFKSMRQSIYADLMKVCYESMWQVRVWDNPFYHENQPMAGLRALSINMEQRVPLFSPEGSPVKVWKKDDRGNKLGTSPILLFPERSLETSPNNTLVIRETLF